MARDQAIEKVPERREMLFAGRDTQTLFRKIVKVLADVLGRDPHQLQIPLLGPLKKLFNGGEVCACGQLVGIAVFGTCSDAVQIRTMLPSRPAMLLLSLSRFVLLDEISANAESHSLRRAVRILVNAMMARSFCLATVVSVSGK